MAVIYTPTLVETAGEARVAWRAVDSRLGRPVTHAEAGPTVAGDSFSEPLMNPRKPLPGAREFEKKKTLFQWRIKVLW